MAFNRGVALADPRLMAYDYSLSDDDYEAIEQVLIRSSASCGSHKMRMSFAQGYAYLTIHVRDNLDLLSCSLH